MAGEDVVHHCHSFPVGRVGQPARMRHGRVGPLPVQPGAEGRDYILLIKYSVALRWLPDRATRSAVPIPLGPCRRLASSILGRYLDGDDVELIELQVLVRVTRLQRRTVVNREYGKEIRGDGKVTRYRRSSAHGKDVLRGNRGG